MVPFLGVPPLSRPGCWAYPDMLQIGSFLSFNESRSHFGAWCITSSPLTLSFDLSNRTLVDWAYPIIGNRLAIRVNQEWAGSPGALLRSSTESIDVQVAHTADGALPDQSCRYPVTPPAKTDEFGTPRCEDARLPTWQVWRKPLKNNSVALFVVNIGTEPLSTETINMSFSEAGVSARYDITDIWGRGDDVASQAAGKLAFATIYSHDSAFLLFEPHKEATILHAVGHDVSYV